MGKKIFKYLTVSKFPVSEMVVENGQPTLKTLKDVTYMGKATADNAVKIAQRDEVLKGKALYVNPEEISYENEKYELEIDLFFEHATKVSSNTEKPYAPEKDEDEDESLGKEAPQE